MDTILIPRVSDTKNSSIVSNFILNHFNNLNWDSSVDSFTAATPLGQKQFNNLIFTHNKQSPYTLTLAAHYDSKYFPNQDFIGATDSGFPCSLLLDLATFFTPLLNKFDSMKWGLKGNNIPLPPYLKATGGDRANFTTTFGAGYDGRQLDEHDLSLQFIFFDGEEAFENWTHDDSIYGAKHLADTLDNDYIDTSNSHHQSIQSRKLKPHPTELDRIDHLVLLDLLGTPNPSIPNYFSTTKWLYDELVSIEQRINQVADTPSLDPLNNFQSNFFKTKVAHSGIEDDHLPFLHRGVPILHIIPSPFPSVWHKMQDNRDALDIPTMARWNAIMRVFIAEYMQLRPLVH